MILSGDYIWYTKTYWRGDLRVEKTPIRLHEDSHGRTVSWNSGVEQGSWMYYKHGAGSHAREEMLVEFGGLNASSTKKHYFIRLEKTNTWELCHEMGTHNHRRYDTVMLVKVKTDESSVPDRVEG